MHHSLQPELAAAVLHHRLASVEVNVEGGALSRSDGHSAAEKLAAGKHDAVGAFGGNLQWLRNGIAGQHDAIKRSAALIAGERSVRSIALEKNSHLLIVSGWDRARR